MLYGLQEQGRLTSQLCEEGVRSSYFFPVKMSMATKWHFAWPCLPVFDVETSATCPTVGVYQHLVLRPSGCKAMNSSEMASLAIATCCTPMVMCS